MICIQAKSVLKRINCESRFILSGSPIMNNLSELWSIVDFAQPGLLGKHEVFNVQLALPISQEFVTFFHCDYYICINFKVSTILNSKLSIYDRFFMIFRPKIKEITVQILLNLGHPKETLFINEMLNCGLGLRFK